LGVFQDLMEFVAISLRKFVEPAPARIRGGHGILREPLPAGVMEEVLAWLARLVENSEVGAVIGL
jgi:hypothetical protein